MRTYWYRGLVVGVVFACAGGCGGGDDDDNGGATVLNQAAYEKCNALLDVYCPSIVDCAVSGDILSAEERDTAVSQCRPAAAQSIDCKRAVEVTSNYDPCMSALANPDCDAVNAALESDGTVSPLPTVCQGVILIAQ